MSDTPETDHLENELGSAAKFSHPVIWRHARQLEIERDEAREDAQKSKAYKRVLKVTNENLKRERDKAREEAHRFRSLYYSHLGINGSASWFPWEEKLNE
jgi:uncharacterized protein (DUF3084 family)